MCVCRRVCVHVQARVPPPHARTVLFWAHFILRAVSELALAALEAPGRGLQARPSAPPLTGSVPFTPVAHRHLDSVPLACKPGGQCGLFPGDTGKGHVLMASTGRGR